MTTLNLAQSRFFTLPNGLRVMLCPPPQGTSAYVSMAVKAGHFFDPQTYPGLAHLLEHALFLGSRHLPKANAINDLIERCGGMLNAWTGTEYANYHFHCHESTLPSLLPAFADMLAHPLLEQDALQKEVEAIDAEFKFKRKDDLRRLYQIHKETCNPAHPFSKFSVGNADIFQRNGIEALQEALTEHHRTFYGGSNMTLCIFSAIPADTLIPLIKKQFGILPAGEPAPCQWPALYLPEQLGTQITIEPLQAARRMIVTFPLPPLHNDYKVKPLDYISHLLGDEGEGSLLNYLKNRNWVTNLIAGSGIEGDDFKDFNVSFQLTQDGLTHREEILMALFSFLTLLRQGLAEQWRYDEKMQLHALAYQYEDSPKLMPVACEYAQHLFIYDFDEIPLLRAPVETYDSNSLEHALSYFTPSRIRVKVIAPGIDTDKVCDYYNAKYSISRLPDTLVENLSQAGVPKNMALPPPNPYLGDAYTLCLPDNDYALPKLICQKQGYRSWFAQDHQFHTPKGDIYLSFDTAGFCSDVNATAAKRIWLACLNDKLQSQYYRAEIAGLHYRLYGHQAGFSLHTRGFTNQQVLLAKQLIKAINTTVPNKEQFALRKSMQIQNLQNSLLNKPTNRLFSRLSVLIQRNTQAPVDLLSAVNACTYDDMMVTAESAMSKYYLETFMHGNWLAEEAEQFSADVNILTPQASGEALARSVSRLPTGKTLIHQVPSEHDDAAVVLYLQAPSATIEDTVMCMVLEQMLAGPFFNVLRTQKQLGYVVGTGYVPHNQHPGMALYVQSPRYSAQDILAEITHFLFDQLNEIDYYSAYWKNIQENLLKQLDEQDLSLSMKSQRLWISLGTADYTFNRNARLARCVNALSFDKVRNYAQRVANRELYGELVLFAQGHFNTHTMPSGLRVDDIAEFKNMLNH
ncbi:insulinase family protein [Salinimonas chungwhensis]|uniref:insulinase family protein n=1 Tax=Salinimonas chungwhensis TaxID=265425 RepID=UPI0004777114|nr:insulinase family protein [Salinimonas chungwhensis]